MKNGEGVSDSGRREGGELKFKRLSLNTVGPPPHLFTYLLLWGLVGELLCEGLLPESLLDNIKLRKAIDVDRFGIKISSGFFKSLLGLLFK